MIVIDEHADNALIKHLEKIRSSEEATRCIHFKLADYVTKHSKAGNVDAVVAQAKSVIMSALQRHLPDRALEIYICDDGDVIALAPLLPVKEAKMAMLEASGNIGVRADEEFVSFYELNSHISQLIIHLQEKIDTHNKAREQQQKQREIALAERKRQNILSRNIPATLIANINERRLQHEIPAIMVIEDDAFSRRLVENVLHNQFAITALGTADTALETYAKLAPNLLFLDINLPSVTGIELLEKIIAFDPNAYVIMLSGNADKDNVITAMKLGAKGFVGKPFTKEKLLQYINRCPTIKTS